MYRVLLITLVKWDSLMEFPALLKNGGCTVDLFCIDGSWALQNEYYENWIQAPEDHAAFVARLITFIESEGHNYQWIIPGDDVLIRLLNDRITDEKLFYRIMPITKIENRELLGSKAGFSGLCTRYAIKTPAYLIYNETLTTEAISSVVGYPLLMKLDKSEGGVGVFLCEKEFELVRNLEKVGDKTNIVFQQFIKGYDVNTEALFREGELVVYCYSRTVKVMGKFGVSTQRLFYQNIEIEPELKKIGKVLGLNGFCNIVFMYDEIKKQHYLIEVDSRPNGWMYYGKFAGNDFSAGVQKVITGDISLALPDEKLSAKPLKISIYKKDMNRCIIEKDFIGILFWLFNIDDRWKYIPHYDRKLHIATNEFLKATLWAYIKGKLKKTFGMTRKETGA